MIYNSSIWKEDLIINARIIEATTEKPVLAEEELLDQLEKAIFLSAFIIRKLMDSKTKVSDEVDDLRLNIDMMASKEKDISLLSSDKIDRYYDLSNPVSQNVKLRTLCDQLIHSFVFTFSFNESGFAEGFFVASDYVKCNKLYWVEMKKWQEAISFVVEDNIVALKMMSNNNTDFSLEKIRG